MPASMAKWIVRSLVERAAKEQISLLPTAFCCLHEGCQEVEYAVYTLIQCVPLLVENADVAPHVTLRFTVHEQVSVQAREPPCL